MERFNYPVSVEFTVENFAQILRQQGEDLVLKAIAECGVNVDKDELKRALDISQRAVCCRECKCYEPLQGVCTHSSADPYEQEVMDPDDFCSSGERREEDDELPYRERGRVTSNSRVAKCDREHSGSTAEGDARGRAKVQRR